MSLGAALLVTGMLSQSPQTRTSGRAMLEIVTEGERFERRRRRLAGGLQVGVGATQVSLGAVMLAEADSMTTATARAGRMQTVTGSLTTLGGLVTLIQRGPLAKLRRSAAYRDLEAAPSSPQALAAFEHAWAETTRRARRYRMVVGGLTIAGGVFLSTFGTARAIAYRNDEANTVVDYGMIATGAGLLGLGISSVVLPSETERSYNSHARRRPHAHVSAGPGMLWVSGRF